MRPDGVWRRIRWGNVARLAALIALALVVAVWPKLGDDPPRLPPAEPVPIAGGGSEARASGAERGRGGERARGGERRREGKRGGERRRERARGGERETERRRTRAGEGKRARGGRRREGERWGKGTPPQAGKTPRVAVPLRTPPSAPVDPVAVEFGVP